MKATASVNWLRTAHLAGDCGVHLCRAERCGCWQQAARQAAPWHSHWVGSADILTGCSGKKRGAGHWGTKDLSPCKKGMNTEGEEGIDWELVLKVKMVFLFLLFLPHSFK